MRPPRIFQNQLLNPHGMITLDIDASRHLTTVLRLKEQDKIILFNGDGLEHTATIVYVKKQTVQVKIINSYTKNNESPLKIHLGQVISKGERMDFVVQKATELGVHSITPLFSERSVVHLKGERLDKKKEHWQKVVISACEQCGRTLIPTVFQPISILEWIHAREDTLRLVLNLSAEKGLPSLSTIETVAVLIGPEGGLSDQELEYAQNKGFVSVQLGPRVLRTETATLAAITALQLLGGDF